MNRISLFGRWWSVHDASFPYIVSEVDFSYEALSGVFSKYDVKAIYIVSSSNRLVGCISKGDFLRSTSDALRLNEVPYCEQIPLAHRKDLPASGGYNSIPLVDSNGRLVKILERSVGNDVVEPVTFIAEIGNNHQGCIENAFKLIDAAVDSGATYVKFQARCLDEVYIDTSDQFLKETDYSTAYTVRQLTRYNLSQSDLSKVFSYCDKVGVKRACTPFDTKSAQFLLDQNIDLIKVASADLSNFELLEALSRFNGKILMSTGMHDFSSIRRAAEWASANALNVTFLHTNSTYPTPFSDVDLRKMPALAEYSTSGLFGYSGHERGWHVPLAAVALGASFVEKHFTFSKDLDGNDHKVSLLPAEFKTMVSLSRDVEVALRGSADITRRSATQGELVNHSSLSKGVYLKHSVDKGVKLSRSDVILRSPCIGLTPGQFEDLLDIPVNKKLQKFEALEYHHFKVEDAFMGSEGLGAFGLPCRLRDIKSISNVFSPTFLEYHMFSTDLEIDVKKYRQIFKNKKFMFHAPEQFDDGFVLDLVSADSEISRRSENELDRVIAWVLSAMECSRQVEAPLLVVNVGGASMDTSYDICKPRCFEVLARTHEKLKGAGIQFRPQTMPPFPWHFGGQGFHNLFLDLQDIVEVQDYFDARFCLDLSHSMLACKHLGKDFYAEMKNISDYVDYLHVADAAYPAQEGIQLGSGDIDFKKAFDILEVQTRNISWIPEIWRGHLENFKGFREALNYVRRMYVDE